MLSWGKFSKKLRLVFFGAFYRTQVSLVRSMCLVVSKWARFVNLTYVTLADEDTDSILTGNTNRTIQGNVAMQVTQHGGQVCNFCKWRHLMAPFAIITLALPHCINWIVLLTLSVSIELVPSLAESHQLSFKKVSQWVRDNQTHRSDQETWVRYKMDFTCNISAK